MKTKQFWILSTLLIVLLIGQSTNIILNSKGFDRRTQILEKKFSEVDSIMQHRTYLDSLYWNHLEECAFELREGLVHSKHD